MKATRFNWRKALSLLMAAAMLALCLTACGGDDFDKLYSEYSQAFRNVTANKCFDVDLAVTVVMDGNTQNATGNFKMDNTGDVTLLYLTVQLEDGTITQFSDGEYLYTEDARDPDHIQKFKSKLGESSSSSNSKDSAPSGKQQADISGQDPNVQQNSAPTFNTSSFLSEFASFLEAGKIRDLGILESVPKAAITKITKENSTYHLTVGTTVINTLMDTMADSITADDDYVSVKNLRNFSYDATVSGDYITGITYKGTMDVTIKAAIAESGEDTEYDMDVTIKTSYNNPGSTVSFELPSTEGYN